MFYFILIPIITFAIIAYYQLKKTHTINLFHVIPTGITLIFILIMYGIASVPKYSTEYRGHLAIHAKYYEYWESFKEETCTREEKIGETCVTDANGRTNCTPQYKTVEYDCSYCDTHPARWELYSNDKKVYSITENYYAGLVKQWSSKPKFYDMERYIVSKKGCGVNGDMYQILWDKKVETSEHIITEYTYANKVKGSLSAFNYQETSQEDIEKYGLYEYPKYHGFRRQNPILGIDGLELSPYTKENVIKKYEFLNGSGYKTHGMVYVLLFPNKDISVAKKQEQYWFGGNRNEVVICIGYDPVTKKLDWVKPFSWTDNKRVHVEIREELMEIGVLDLDKFFPKIHKVMYEKYKPKDIKDFEYLETETPSWVYKTIFIGSLLITLLGWVFVEKIKY